MVSGYGRCKNQGSEGWADTGAQEGGWGLAECYSFTLGVMSFLAPQNQSSRSSSCVYLTMVPLKKQTEDTREQARRGPVGPCKGTASLPFLQLPSLCENMRYPLMPFKPGCYFVAGFFQTLSVSNWKWASVNCSHSKRSIILSSRALVTLYLQRKTRLLALILPTTL